MPIKIGGVGVERLYRRNLEYVYEPNYTGETSITLDPPGGTSCEIVGEALSYNGDIYVCREIKEEVLHMKNSSNVSIHKRTASTFNLNYDGGGTHSIQLGTWGVTQITQPSNPSRTGYTFNNWWTAQTGGSQLSFWFLAPEYDTTYYARWNLITYTISRILGTGVTAATISPTTYNVETETFIPTISGVTYVPGYGSYTVSPALTGIAKGSTGNKTYTVTANKLNYTITVNANGGTGGTNPSSYQISTSAQTRSFTPPTRAGFSLNSWTVTGHTGTTPTVSSSTLTIPANTYGYLTMLANWNLITYTLTKGSIPTGVATFVVNRTLSPTGGGSTGILNDGASIYYNDALTLSATASNGYTAPTRSPGNFVTVTGNTTVSVTAGSKINYTITVDRNGGTGGNASATYVVTDNKTLTTLLGTPTRTGYTLSSWKATTTSAGGWTKNTTYAPSTNVLNKYANVTLQAQWTGKSITITLDKQGGTGGTSSIAVVYGTSLSPTSVTVPTRSGYTFGGYYTSTNGGGTQRINASGTYVALTNTTYTTNRTLYAKWVQDDSNMLVWKYDKQANTNLCSYIGYNPLGLECSTLNSTQVIPGIEIGKTDTCSVVVCRRKTASWWFVAMVSSNHPRDAYFEYPLSADQYEAYLWLTNNYPADQYPVGYTIKIEDASNPGNYYLFEAV